MLMLQTCSSSLLRFQFCIWSFLPATRECPNGSTLCSMQCILRGSNCFCCVYFLPASRDSVLFEAGVGETYSMQRKAQGPLPELTKVCCATHATHETCQRLWCASFDNALEPCCVEPGENHFFYIGHTLMHTGTHKYPFGTKVACFWLSLCHLRFIKKLYIRCDGK